MNVTLRCAFPASMPIKAEASCVCVFFCLFVCCLELEAAAQGL